MKYILITLLLLISLLSCNNNSRPNRKQIYETHKNIDSLISFMNKVPESKDTIFLGFRLGMTKKEFRNHIKKLRKEGKKVSYEKNIRASLLLLNTSIDLGDRYVYSTPIYLENYDKEYTGNARCILLPNYNKGGKMASLKVVSIEEWDGSGPIFKKWMESNVQKKYNKYINPSFKHNIIGKICKEILNDDLSDLYYTSETLMVTNPSYIGDVEYWSTKAFVGEAILELKKQQIKKEESKNTTF